MSMAPRITAAVGEPGTPTVTIGSRAPTSAAEAADSGATTPSRIPVPNFSGCLENRLARPYPTNEAGVAPVPGSTPIQNPLIVDRRNVFQYARISFSASNTFAQLIRAATAPLVMMFSSAARSSSPIPNAPTTTTRNLIPARSAKVPNIRRSVPVIVSVPISAMMRPKRTDMTLLKMFAPPNPTSAA